MVKESFFEKYKKAYREIVSEKERKGFIVHFLVYVLINALLIFINFTYSPEYIWFFYPLIFWGFGLLMNYIFNVYWLENRLRKIEKEAEARAKEGNIYKKLKFL